MAAASAVSKSNGANDIPRVDGLCNGRSDSDLFTEWSFRLRLILRVPYIGAMINEDDTDRSKSSQPRSPPPPLEDAREAVLKAMNDLYDAIQVLERSASWHGFLDGWKAGRVDIFDEFKKQFSDNKSSTPPATLSTQPVPPPVADVTYTPMRVEVSANDRVLRVIETNPGLRGYEIAQLLGRPPGSMRERTVRTALHRLKKAVPPKIKIVDGRWYAADAAPADPQPSLME